MNTYTFLLDDGTLYTFIANKLRTARLILMSTLGPNIMDKVISINISEIPYRERKKIKI